MQKKKGISLIVLVITIIVMIILAATIILAINNNNVVDKAKDAVSETNYKQVQELAQVAWAEGYVAGKTTQTELDAYVKESLLNSGMSQSELNKYTITVTTTGVTVTKGGSVSESEGQGIWKVYNFHETLDNESYYMGTYIKIESIYKQYTLKEYKEKYILRAMAGEVDDEEVEEVEYLLNYITLDDFVIDAYQSMIGLHITSIDDILEMIKESDGTIVTRDELVYTYLFETTDVDAVLESMGYVASDIETEYNNWVQEEVPTEYANKTYTITFPDESTETVLGTDLGNYLKRYGIAENGSYEIKIFDGTVTEVFEVIATKCAPKTYEDEYYTYTLLTHGYEVEVKDKTLSEYGEILNTIEGCPVTSMFCTFLGCINLIEAPEIPEGITNMTTTFYGCTNLTTAPTIPNSVTSMSGTFYDCTSLTTAPTIPASVTDMSHTFSDCTNLTTAPTIPSNVIYMRRIFENCNKLEGTLQINSTNLITSLEDPANSDGSYGAFNCTGISGSGLTVVVPNDTVRELLIEDSGYDSTYVTIVKELAQ